MATDADGNNNPCAAGRAGASPLVRTRIVLPGMQHDGVHCQAIHHIGRVGSRCVLTSLSRLHDGVSFACYRTSAWDSPFRDGRRRLGRRRHRRGSWWVLRAGCRGEAAWSGRG